MANFDWTSDREVLHQIGGQFALAFSELIRTSPDATELVNGYISGRYSLVLNRGGLTLVDSAAIPKSREK